MNKVRRLPQVYALATVLFIAPAAAQQPLSAAERDYAEQSLHPTCREYYKLLTVCARQKFPSARAQRHIDDELSALVMLSHGNNAERVCLRQIEANRNQRVIDCDWKSSP